MPAKPRHNPHVGVNGLVAYLMLWGGYLPAIGLLPLGILLGPLRLMWNKPVHRMRWRIISLTWLCVSLGVGVTAAFFCDQSTKNGTLIGIPGVFTVQVTSVSNDEIGLPEFSLAPFYRTLMLAMITGLLMLPLSAASCIEASKRAKKLNAR